MTDIFISYAHEDQAFVRRIVSALEAEGFSVWWDHTIPPGKTWNTYIARGIEEARACIVVWSQHSAASKWVMEEATLANDGEKLLPVSIDGSPPPMGFRSMQSAQLQGWSGDKNNAQWQLLVHEARGVVGAAGDGGASVRPAYRPPKPRRGAPVGFIVGAAGTAIAIAVGIAAFVFLRPPAQTGAVDAAIDDHAAEPSAEARPASAAANELTTETDALAPPNNAESFRGERDEALRQAERERTAPEEAAQRAAPQYITTEADWIVGTWRRVGSSPCITYLEFRRAGDVISWFGGDSPSEMRSFGVVGHNMVSALWTDGRVVESVLRARNDGTLLLTGGEVNTCTFVRQ